MRTASSKERTSDEDREIGVEGLIIAEGIIILLMIFNKGSLLGRYSRD